MQSLRIAVIALSLSLLPYVISADQQGSAPVSPGQSKSKTSTSSLKPSVLSKASLTSKGSTSKTTQKTKKSILYPVLINTDEDCTVKIDDDLIGKELTADNSMALKLEPGEHLIVAISNDEKDSWRQVVKLDAPTQKVVAIALAPLRQAREQAELAKDELAKAQAQDASEKAQAAVQQAAAEKAQEDRELQEVAAKQKEQETQSKIADLRSQIAQLQNEIDMDNEDAQEQEQAADQLQAECDASRAPCTVIGLIILDRNHAATDRREVEELQGQVRDLQTQILNLQSQ